MTKRFTKEDKIFFIILTILFIAFLTSRYIEEQQKLNNPSIRQAQKEFCEKKGYHPYQEDIKICVAGLYRKAQDYEMYFLTNPEMDYVLYRAYQIEKEKTETQKTEPN